MRPITPTGWSTHATVPAATAGWQLDNPGTSDTSGFICIRHIAFHCMFFVSVITLNTPRCCLSHWFSTKRSLDSTTKLCASPQSWTYYLKAPKTSPDSKVHVFNHSHTSQHNIIFNENSINQGILSSVWLFFNAEANTFQHGKVQSTGKSQHLLT